MAGALRHHGMSPVTADIVKYPDCAIISAHRENAPPEELESVCRPGFRHFTQMTERVPGGPMDAGQFLGEHISVAVEPRR